MKSASKIGSSTIFVAICMTRSRITGIPSGRIFPSGFGISFRLAGRGWYLPSLKVSWISFMNRSLLYPLTMWSMVTPSTPPLPPFALTRFHASQRMSLRCTPFGLIGSPFTASAVRDRVSLVPGTTFSTCRSPCIGEFFRAAFPRASRVPWSSPIFPRLDSLLTFAGYF